MDDRIRLTLQALIRDYGRTLADDPRRCEAMLKDLCAAQRREIAVLIAALRERVASDLLSNSAQQPAAMLMARLTQRLIDDLALQPQAARWTVESWALVLGVIDPSAVSAPAPTVSALATVVPASDWDGTAPRILDRFETEKGTGSASAIAAPPRSPPPQQPVPGSGLRSSKLAIIGIVIVLLWILGISLEVERNRPSSSAHTAATQERTDEEIGMEGIPDTGQRAQQTTAGGRRLYVRPSGALNARSGPGTDHSIIRSLEPRTPLMEIRRSGDWSKVEILGVGRGWVHNGFVVEDLPVASDKPRRTGTSREHVVTVSANAPVYFVRPDRHLNARSGPSTQHDILYVLRPGTALREIQRRGRWSMVVTANDSEVLWVHNGFLVTRSELNATARKGLWADYAEEYARRRGCAVGALGAVLLQEAPTYELHEVHCDGSNNFLLRCQGGVCQETR
ncbi:MAG: SH3 domain-containing protein [Chromatiaceae bacterium]|nr:MAG: SH3 domain-containing protein [Chromatiaceae bacterium]